MPKRAGSARQGGRTSSSASKESSQAEGKKAEVNYQTKVVGGVVVRTPMRSVIS